MTDDQTDQALNEQVAGLFTGEMAYWCPECAEFILSVTVTHDERHDLCGCPVHTPRWSTRLDAALELWDELREAGYDFETASTGVPWLGTFARPDGVHSAFYTWPGLARLLATAWVEKREGEKDICEGCADGSGLVDVGIPDHPGEPCEQCEGEALMKRRDEEDPDR